MSSRSAMMLQWWPFPNVRAAVRGVVMLRILGRLLVAVLLSSIAHPASASIAIDVTTSKDLSTSSTTVTTPAFSTAAANELLLAFISTDYSSGTNTTVTSIAGGGLTWVLVIRTNVQSGTAEIWRAFAPSALTNVSVTATLSQSVASSITVMSFTGTDTSGINGSGAIGATRSGSAASGAPTATLVTTRANSWVFGVGNDYDRAIARTPGTGQTLVHQYLATIGDTYWVQRQNTTTPLSGTSVTINDTAPTTDRYNLSVCEILTAPGTLAISGTISPSSGGSGATVTLSGSASATVSADSAGSYSFNGLANGSYTVTPSKSGYTFTPLNQSVTVNGTSVSGINFTAQAVPSTWNISGTISPASGGNGAMVTLGGATSASVTADSSGNYSFSGLANGTYTVTPSKSGYTFTPASRTVTVNGANVSGIGFTAQPAASSGIHLVQTSVNGFESSVASISATFSSTNTAGNFLIVTGTAARPAGSIVISDTAGNTYIPALGPLTDVPQDVTAYIWYVPSCRGGANTITLTPGAPRAMEIHISEWSGLATNAPLDQTASASGFGTAASSGSVTTAVNGELIFGYTFISNSATAGTGFTPLTLVNGDLDEYQIQATAGPVAATFTQASGDWFVLMATFKPAVTDTRPPTVAMTAPANGATVSGTTIVSATASDDVAVAGVQFQLDGANLGAEATSAPYSVAWNTITIGDGSHTLTAIARDAAGNQTTSTPITVTVNNASNPAAVGQWSAPFELGLVAVNAIMLHTGKVLMYSGSFATSAVERVWDPASGDLTLVPNPYYNLFCSGHSQLADGRILVVGGFDSATLGAANANIFDPVTQTWSALPNMAYRRWYPTSTTLPDGRVLVTSGAQTCLTCLADVPEIFDPATGRFTTLPSARLGVPYYPFMFVLPDGKALDAGANENPVATSKLDIAAGTWTTVDPVVRDGHSAAMYQPGKILKSGTAADSGTAGNAAATAYVLDANQPSPAWRQIASMAYPRAFHNTTLLPDGSVLVTGGGTVLDGYDVTKAVFSAELWSPTSEAWQTLSRAAVPRLYHSTALLLPDGRVLTAGSGNDGPAVNQTRGELFSPPYLFKGARPTISSAPDQIQYGATFPVQTSDAASVASVSLIRPGAVTHAFDQDQRFLGLNFTAGTDSITVQAPANANLAPPGFYMLFLVNSAGVPSIAAFVHLPAPSVDTEPPTPPTGLSGQGQIGSATLTWGASTDNTGVALYNVHRATTSGFQPTTANRAGQSTSTSFSDIGLAAGTYYYVVTAQDVVGNVSGMSNEVSVTVLADTAAPTVTITTPGDQTTVWGSIPVTASASDDVGVAGVQFQLDGQALGAERTTPPYSVTWDTSTTSNGAHSITAVARDAAGNRAQATVTVIVSNTSQTPNGLVAAFSFNQGSGVQVPDASGQGNTGTISSATWTTAGKFGAALSFNGSSSWVTVADAASLDLTTGMTIEAWVNPSSGSGWRSVVLKERAGGLAYALYSANNGSRPAGYVHTSTDIGASGTSAVPFNVWTHLALTYDGATIRLFVNGVQVGSRAAAGAAVVTSGALRIGGNSVWGEYFKGKIDEVRIYNRALTAAQIQTDMNTPIP
jgi:hypothetical protein